MIHTRRGVRCERCYCLEDVGERTKKGQIQEGLLRALGFGQKTLGQLALGVFGSDTPETRRQVSSNLQRLGDAVESVDGKGTWRLAYAKKEQSNEVHLEPNNV